jgi:glycerol-3-phosphate dehydrogenase (NAD(P)+)
MAIALSENHEVSLWSRDAAHREALRADRQNRRYLEGAGFPAGLRISDSLPDSLAGAQFAVLAVPTAGLRTTLEQLRPLAQRPALVWLCKGFEAGSMRLPHQVLADVLSDTRRTAVLSGPSFADEVARGLPAAVTLASSDNDFAAYAAQSLHTGRLRIYSSDDLVGVEIGGAVKNVIAIAAGVCDGLNLGNSARAALITRGLAEITRLGVRLGGRIETFMGLSGVGDLSLTCTSDLSRNRRVGLALASGARLNDILSNLGHVAEGVNTAREVWRLAQQLKVDMPITEAITRVLDGGLSPLAAVEALLQREPKAERAG